MPDFKQNTDISLPSALQADAEKAFSKVITEATPPLAAVPPSPPAPAAPETTPGAPPAPVPSAEGEAPPAPAPAWAYPWKPEETYRIPLSEDEDLEVSGVELAEYVQRAADLDEKAEEIEEDAQLQQVAKVLDYHARTNPEVFSIIQSLVQRGRLPDNYVQASRGPDGRFAGAPPAPNPMDEILKDPNLDEGQKKLIEATLKAVQAQVEPLRRDLEAQRAAAAENARRANAYQAQLKIHNEIETAMAAQPIFKDPRFSEAGKRLVWGRLSEQQNLPASQRRTPQQLAADTAALFGGTPVAALQQKIQNAAAKQEAKTGVGTGLSPTTVPQGPQYSGKDLEDSVKVGSKLQDAAKRILQKFSLNQ